MAWKPGSVRTPGSGRAPTEEHQPSFPRRELPNKRIHARTRRQSARASAVGENGCIPTGRRRTHPILLRRRQNVRRRSSGGTTRRSRRAELRQVGGNRSEDELIEQSLDPTDGRREPAIVANAVHGGDGQARLIGIDLPRMDIESSGLVTLARFAKCATDHCKRKLPQVSSARRRNWIVEKPCSCER